MLLLGVWKLGDSAYGVSLRNYLIEITGKYWSIGAIYDVLDRLMQKGFLKSNTGDPVPERGGKSKRYYQITKQGSRALEEIRRIQMTMWSGFPRVSIKNESQ